MALDSTDELATDAVDALIRPVVLCGGSGSRLWPLSRTFFPKQLLSVERDQTMLQGTVRRTTGPRFRKAVIVTGEEHRFLVRQQLQTASLDPEIIILEPEGRDTAPAIALAAFFDAATNRDQLLLVLPSDHVIGDIESFLRCIAAGVSAAESGKIVSFGVIPASAVTTSVDVEAADRHPTSSAGRAAVRLVENPEPRIAEHHCKSGRHVWSGGILLFRAGTLIEEVTRFAPDVASACKSAMERATRDGNFLRPNSKAFLASPSLSIDHALIEKSERSCLIPIDTSWFDVDSWDTLWEISEKDENSNVLKGEVVAVESSGSLIRSESEATIATLGIDNLIIVATRDAILVVPRNRAGETKKLVGALGHAGIDKLSLPPRVHRPWGSYETVDRGDRFQTKHIVVKPGEKLSLQKHQHRSEHWIIVAGSARVTVGDQVLLLQENQSAYIPAGTIHRLENPGATPLHLVEVQCGSYLGEDDIVRLEDDYGRLPQGD